MLSTVSSLSLTQAKVSEDNDNGTPYMHILIQSNEIYVCACCSVRICCGAICKAQPKTGYCVKHRLRYIWHHTTMRGCIYLRIKTCWISCVQRARVCVLVVHKFRLGNHMRWWLYILALVQCLSTKAQPSLSCREMNNLGITCTMYIS